MHEDEIFIFRKIMGDMFKQRKCNIKIWSWRWENLWETYCQDNIISSHISLEVGAKEIESLI